MKSTVCFLLVLSTALVVSTGCNEGSPTAPLAPCLLPDQPSIAFASIPPLGSTARVRGVVNFVNPACDAANFRVALYIFVPRFSTSIFICKPFQDNPLTAIDQDGNWNSDYATGGIDTSATQFHAFLVRADFSGQCFTASLPAIDHVSVLASVGLQQIDNTYLILRSLLFGIEQFDL